MGHSVAKTTLLLPAVPQTLMYARMCITPPCPFCCCQCPFSFCSLPSASLQNRFPGREEEEEEEAALAAAIECLDRSAADILQPNPEEEKGSPGAGSFTMLYF